MGRGKVSKVSSSTLILTVTGRSGSSLGRTTRAAMPSGTGTDGGGVA